MTIKKEVTTKKTNSSTPKKVVIVPNEDMSIGRHIFVTRLFKFLYSNLIDAYAVVNTFALNMRTNLNRIHAQNFGRSSFVMRTFIDQASSIS